MCSSFLPRAEFSFKELAQALGAAWREQTDKTVGTFQFAGAAQIAITLRPRELIIDLEHPFHFLDMA